MVANEAERRVDITMDGKPFTSYIWPTSLKKPVLYPLITDEDVTVTRGISAGAATRESAWIIRTMRGSGSTTAT